MLARNLISQYIDCMTIKTQQGRYLGYNILAGPTNSYQVTPELYTQECN